MRGQTIAKACAAIVVSFALSACGGGGGGSPFNLGSSSGSSSGTSSSSSSSGGTTSSSSSSGSAAAVAAHIIIQSSSLTLSTSGGTAASTVIITATVTDGNNVTLPSYPVSFTADGGLLSPASTVTDTSGNITATLGAGSATVGSTITVSAQASPLTAVSVGIKVASTTPSYSLGSLSNSGAFTANVIAIGQSPLSAGGSSGLQVSLVDTNNGNTPFTGSATVSFSSTCQSKGLATITTPVASSTGTFNSTYQAAGCSGNDVITASVNINGSVISASGTINVSPATLGSLLFDVTSTAALPACDGNIDNCTIGLKGTGQNESTQVFFKVLDSNGHAIPNQAVTFGLSTTAGGLSVNPSTAISDANGEVSTTVTSGTVHTSVRVTAQIASAKLSSESSLLTVSTGFPAQNSFSIAATSLNLIGNDLVGNTSTITVRLSDRYNNPVPDGTAVSFTSECGQVDKSCNTVNGGCTATFTTQNPRSGTLLSGNQNLANANNCAASTSGAGNNLNLGCDDHRCTVVAYAVGEESFNDCNGTGNYVSIDSGANNVTQCPHGDFFVSLPEVWVDSNENGSRDGDFEPFIDFNNNGTWDPASGKFIGLLCTDPDCDTNQSTLNVSQSLVIVMTSTTLQSRVYLIPAEYYGPDIVPTKYVAPGQTGFSYLAQDPSTKAITAAAYPTGGETLTIPFGCVAGINVLLGDTSWQVPPVGTSITSTIAPGGAGGQITFGGTATVLNTDSFGYYTTQASLKAPKDSSGGSSDQFVVTTVAPASAGQTAATVSTAFTVNYVTGICP
jgi:hypothetical protein